MYVSRLLFHTVPGKTGEVERELKKLREMVTSAGARARTCTSTSHLSARLMQCSSKRRPDLSALEEQISKLTHSSEFQTWSRRMSALLVQSPKREVYIVSELTRAA